MQAFPDDASMPVSCRKPKLKPRNCRKIMRRRRRHWRAAPYISKYICNNCRHPSRNAVLQVAAKRGRKSLISLRAAAKLPLKSNYPGSTPGSIVEEVVHQLGRRRVEARRLFEVGQPSAGDVLGGAEGVEEGALAARADAGDFVERVL